jgi:hypothetical protein
MLRRVSAIYYNYFTATHIAMYLASIIEVAIDFCFLLI